MDKNQKDENKITELDIKELENISGGVATRHTHHD